MRFEGLLDRIAWHRTAALLTICDDPKATQDDRRLAARACLNDPDPSIRNAAVELLGQVGKSQDWAYLKPLLHDPDWVVRCSAADAIGDLGGKRAHKALVACALEDPRGVVRKWAFYSLAYCVGEPALPFIKEQAKRQRSAQALIGVYVGLTVLGERAGPVGLLRVAFRAKNRDRNCALGDLIENIEDVIPLAPPDMAAKIEDRLKADLPSHEKEQLEALLAHLRQ